MVDTQGRPIEDYPQFKTLAAMRTPHVIYALAWMITIGFVLTSLALVYLPWVQTSAGDGAVIALDPGDRVQSITALVPGRVERWYVRDGQLVKKGDPIAQITDNDPDLLARLASEREQVEAEIMAVILAQRVASFDVDRSRQLFAEGLVARREYELAQIKVAEQGAKIAESRAKLNRIDTSINRQSAQLVRAPRDGRLQQLNSAAGGTLVSAGTVLAMIAAEAPVRAVELYIDGQDVALLRRGLPVRLQFEGWPAFQFSGWPTTSFGMFAAEILAIDPSAQPSGLFRVIIVPQRGGDPWPGEQFIRIGAKVRGYIQMETVPLGYELWRQLNDFPLEFGKAATKGAAMEAEPK
jgi:multidrug efflux pump subunit AcrA (membrane-fusion protein)